MIGKNMALLGVFIFAFITPCLCLTESVTFKYQQSTPPAELSCAEAEDSVKVKWHLNGTDVTGRKDWEKEFTVFESNKTLRLLKVDPTTVGPYTCHYENSTAIKTFTIRVEPYVEPFAKGKNVIEGDPLSLECNAWGLPDALITWFRNNTVRILPDSSKVSLKNNSASSTRKFPVLDNSTLRIEQLTYEEGGNYTCFVTVVIDGKEMSANATILVQVKDKYAALWPFLGICVEVAILCTIILIYEKRRAKRIAEEERQEEAERLNAPSDTKTPLNDDVRQRK